MNSRFLFFTILPCLILVGTLGSGADTESARSLTAAGEEAFRGKRYAQAESYFRRALQKSLEKKTNSIEQRLCLINLQRALDKQGRSKDAAGLGKLSSDQLRMQLSEGNRSRKEGAVPMKNGTQKTDTEPIGYATMLADGTIRLDLRRTSDGGMARSVSDYKPDNPNYADVLKHIGGLKTGDRKLVYPWP